MGDADDCTDHSSATLGELRLRIEALATRNGRFLVACARTGESPVPGDGCRFPDRETAAEAAQYVIAYRERLREMDPRTPRYDPVVHEVGGRARLVGDPSLETIARLDTAADRSPEPSAGDGSAEPGRG
jgi:hypothetical protein